MMGDERRDQIAKAVMELAAERGAGAISIAAVAHRIGVTPSALYRHYPSKDAMLSATLDLMSERMGANVERARAGPGGPLQALERLLALQIELIRASRGLPFFVFAEGLGDSAAHRDQFHALVRKFRARLAALFREAQEQGQVRDDIPAENLAISFIGLYVPPAILWNLSRGRFDITAQARRAWTVFHEGIRARGAAAPRATRRTRAPRAQEKPS
jgi:AcrR family transcriptional regulator